MKQEIKGVDENGNLEIIREILIPGNEIKPGIWEGKATKEEMSGCNYIKVRLCMHERAHLKYCPACGAMQDTNGKWER